MKPRILSSLACATTIDPVLIAAYQELEDQSRRLGTTEIGYNPLTNNPPIISLINRIKSKDIEVDKAKVINDLQYFEITNSAENVSLKLIRTRKGLHAFWKTNDLMIHERYKGRKRVALRCDENSVGALILNIISIVDGMEDLLPRRKRG